MNPEIVVLVTAPSELEAEKIGQTLVGEKLAACANLVRGIQSIFFWQGKVCRESEVLIVIKTRSDLFEPLMARVKSLHSYTVPEIIALPIIKGSEDYLRWIRESTLRAKGFPSKI
jgi:periplasmic divalent cation tolerance protein